MLSHAGELPIRRQAKPQGRHSGTAAAVPAKNNIFQLFYSRDFTSGKGDFLDINFQLNLPYYGTPGTGTLEVWVWAGARFLLGGREITVF